MKIIISKKFGATPNELLNHKCISFKSKGLYAYIQSKPDEWEFSVSNISSQSKESLDAIRQGLLELEKYGYLLRKKYQNNAGHWYIDYYLAINPFEFPITENPMLENPIQENPTLENPITGKPQNNSKQEVSKKEISKQEMSNISQKNSLKNLLTSEHNTKYGQEMITEFKTYWNSQNGKQTNFDKQKIFDIEKRLATWFRNANNIDNLVLHNRLIADADKKKAFLMLYPNQDFEKAVKLFYVDCKVGREGTSYKDYVNHFFNKMK